MPQFVVIAYDAQDSGAYDRRLRIKASHADSITKLRAAGKILLGVALTDEDGKMVGSVVVTNFPSRAEFDEWLALEPYVVGKVWEDITVLTGELGPSFADLLKKN